MIETIDLERCTGWIAGRSAIENLQAPHPHELVRLKETEAMVLAAGILLRASLHRTESPVSHLREDFEARDDARWLCWVDVKEDGGAAVISETPIPMPICAPGQAKQAPVQRSLRGALKI